MDYRVKKGTVLFLKGVLIDNVIAAYDPSLGNAFRVSQLVQDPLRVGVLFPHFLGSGTTITGGIT